MLPLVLMPTAPSTPLLSDFRAPSNWPMWFGDRAAAIGIKTHQRLVEAVSAWELTDLKAMADGNLGLVCSALRHGQRVVLKVSPSVDDSSLRAEALGLRAWSSTGAAVSVIDLRDGGLTLLLERLNPGSSLAASPLTVEEKLVLLGRLARSLHSVDRAPDGVPALEEGNIGLDLLKGLTGSADLDGYRRLLQSPHRRVLLHGDLHGYNVLRSGSGWKVIDPKPCFGDPHADVFALLTTKEKLSGSPSEWLVAIDRWIGIYCGEAGLSPSRARDWVCLRATSSARDIRTQKDPTAQSIEWADHLEKIAHSLGLGG